MTVTMSLVLSSIPIQVPPSSMQDSVTIALGAFFITPVFLPTRITTLKATLPQLSDKKVSSSGPSSLSNLSIDLFLERNFLTNLPVGMYTPRESDRRADIFYVRLIHGHAGTIHEGLAH